jgi:methionyl-tRNA synthetase
MMEKYRGGVVPRADVGPDGMDGADAADIAGYHAAMDGTRGFLLHEALGRAMACVARGNEYVQASQPWAIARRTDEEGTRALDTVLASLIRQLARQAVLLAPFMPVKAQALWEQLGAPGRVLEQRFASLASIDPTGWKVVKGDGLFPRAAKPA